MGGMRLSGSSIVEHAHYGVCKKSLISSSVEIFQVSVSVDHGLSSFAYFMVANRSERGCKIQVADTLAILMLTRPYSSQVYYENANGLSNRGSYINNTY